MTPSRIGLAMVRLRQAKRLYACARVMEGRCAASPCKEAAREIALMALDTIADVRGEIQNAAKRARVQ